MKGTDKYLFAIVAGIVVLVCVTFVIVLLRPEPEYRSDDSPEAATHNYLLALRKGDYERAYEYLSSSLLSYPDDVESFTDDVEEYGWLFGLQQDVALNVLSATVRNNSATVEVLESIFDNSGLFVGGSHDTRFDMKLRLENGSWKLIEGDRYWNSCWEQVDSNNTFCPQ